MTAQSIFASDNVTIVIRNLNNYDLTDYQVKIDITNITQAFGTKLIKIVDANGNKVNFCYEQANRECNTAPSNIIWVKVPFIPANGETTLYIVPSDINEATSGKKVFVFYEDFEDGDLNEFTTGGDLPFGICSDRKYQGYYSACSDPNIYDYQNSWMKLTINCDTKCKVSFYWSVSSESYYDFLRFYIDGSEKDEISGEVGWTHKEYILSSGYHTLVWAYTKDNLFTFGADKGWVDLIVIRKHADQEPIITIKQIHITITISNKTTKSLTSLLNVTVEIQNSRTENITTTIYYILDNSVVYSKQITIPAFSIIYDSYVYKILKEGSYNISVIVYDPIANKNTTDSFVVNVDLYDYSVTYAGYVEHNDDKYVEKLEYELKVRCGALGHTITVSTWYDKTYTIPCDNTTKTIRDDYKFSSEGTKNVWFKLNAVDPSNSKTFGTASFIADLNPPVIEYINYTFTEGFRNDLKETAKFKVKDSISPKITCEYKFNDARGTVTFNSNEEEKSEEFTLKPEAILEVNCTDLLGHKATKSVTLPPLIVHTLSFREDTTNAEGTPKGNYILVAYTKTKQFTIRNTKPKYLVIKDDPPVHYYLIVESDDIRVLTSKGLWTSSYSRYYYVTRREANVTLYYTDAKYVYELTFINGYSEPVIGVAKLNGRPITHTYVKQYETSSMFLTADLVYEFCAKDIKGLREVCYEVKYFSAPMQTEFVSFPKIVMIEPVTFTFDKLSETEYKVWLALPKAKHFVIKVFHNDKLIETIEDTLVYWEKTYNITESGVYKFIAEIEDYGVKSFIIYKPGGFPTIEGLTGWERELIAFITGLSLLGIIGLVGTSWALFTAGSMMILMAWLLNAPYGVTLSFGIALALVGAVWYLIRLMSS